jgi:HPP family
VKRGANEINRGHYRFVEGAWPWNLIIEVTDEPSLLNCCSVLGDQAHASSERLPMGNGNVRCDGGPGGEPDWSIPGASFGTLTILMLLPDAPVAQPYALIVGSVCGAAVGMGISFLGSGLVMAVLAMIAAFVVISLIHACHPPGVALASIPGLLHPGYWFALLVVLPFTVIAVGSAAAMSKWLRGWPVYPRSLRDCAG